MGERRALYCLEKVECPLSSAFLPPRLMILLGRGYTLIDPASRSGGQLNFVVRQTEPAMDFTFDCQCGQTLRITAVDAGQTKVCRCGTPNIIPSLSELRRRAGQACYDTHISDKIIAMHAQGLLPEELTCARCGRDTPGILNCSVECERPYSHGRGFWSTVLLGLLSPWWMLGVLSRDYKHSEVHGREVVVQTPLRMCPECAAQVHQQTSSARDILQRIPLYAQLFREYPKADVHCTWP
jgi:hypothetical protein